MGDAHVHVVHHHTEIVGRRAVGARDDQIVELAVLEHHRAMHHVVHHHLPVQRVLEADDRRHIRRSVSAIAPAAVVARLLAAGHLIGAQLGKFFLGAVAAIRMPARQQLPDDLLVAIEALGLIERTLVVIEPRPLHAVQDLLDGSLGRALQIGVLDAQHELPAVPARVQPTKQRRAQPPDVQEAGGTRGETGAYAHRARSFWISRQIGV